MANLLERASVVLSPTAYNNGEALCVKPDDGSGDFQFSRNSAATRVNAQGLVEDVQILSGNLVQNGDFSNGSTDWNLGTGWSIGDGVAITDGSQTGVSGWLRQDNVITPGKKYKATFDVTTNDSGIVLRINDSVYYDSPVEGSGSKTFYFTSTGSHIAFSQITGKTASIDNISIKEITDDTNLPRINYEGFSFDGSGNIIPDSGCGSWLFEPQSTNLVTYSEDFSNSYWSKTGNAAVSLSNVLAPNGVDFAYKASGTSSAIYTANYNPTDRLTDARTIYARTLSGTGQVRLCSFNQNTNNLFTITEKWQRFEVNSVIQGGANNFYAVDFRGAGTTLTEVLIWGAQAEEQSYATSYIPTSGQASGVTRNQDVCNNGGSVSTISSTSGVLYAEIAALDNSVTLQRFSLSDGTSLNRIYIQNSTTNNQIFVSVVSNGVSSEMSTTAYDTTQFNKIAIKYKLNDVSLFVNGSKVGTDTSVAMPIGLNKLAYDDGNGGLKFFGKTKCVAVWKEALSDENLAELTTI